MAVIDNPILNSPFIEPTRHFKFDDEGITNAKKKGKQLQFEPECRRDVVPRRRSAHL